MATSANPDPSRTPRARARTSGPSTSLTCAVGVLARTRSPIEAGRGASCVASAWLAAVGRVSGWPPRLGGGGVHEVQDVRDLPRSVREADGHRGGVLAPAPLFLLPLQGKPEVLGGFAERW